MQLTRTINRYGRADLLIVDELGYMELDKRGSELLFQVLTEREEKNSVAIAANQAFGEWTRTFTDPRLSAAIVDRLTFNATIIETGTDSYRQTNGRQATAALELVSDCSVCRGGGCCGGWDSWWVSTLAEDRFLNWPAFRPLGYVRLDRSLVCSVSA